MPFDQRRRCHRAPEGGSLKWGSPKEGARGGGSGVVFEGQHCATGRTGEHWRESRGGRQCIVEAGLFLERAGRLGGELAQGEEWSASASLHWSVLDYPLHAGVQALVRDLNRVYREEPALWEVDFDPSGFAWLDLHAGDENVVAFARRSRDGGRVLVCACNLSPVPRLDRRLALPAGGSWREVLNTDSTYYAGSDVGNLGAIGAEEHPWNGWEHSAPVTLPPLATVWLVPA